MNAKWLGHAVILADFQGTSKKDSPIPVPARL
jgi:hypothetical protein